MGSELAKVNVTLLDDFPPQECAAYLRNSGYASI
jgi:hypothetical protein